MAKSSPLKSLSVRNGSDGKRNLHLKVGDKAYLSIANFYFEFFGFVKFPNEFRHLSGYLLDVTRDADSKTL